MRLHPQHSLCCLSCLGIKILLVNNTLGICCVFFAMLLSLRSLLASPTLDDATSMPANVEAASQWQREPATFKRENERRAAGMPPWGAAGGDQFAHL